MPRSMRDSEDEAEQKTGRTRSQRFTTSSVVNSPLRRSSRIKQIRSSPPSSESDTSSSHHLIVGRSRRSTMDNTETDKLKRGCLRKFSTSDNESIDIDIMGTPKKRTTRNSLAAATTDTPTKINTRAASKRLTRAGSETKSPLLTSRTIRKTRASSVDPESLADQNRSQPGTPVKTNKQVSNSPIKKEDEKKIRIPYIRLDATIVETDECTNSGNSDSSPDKALRSQQSSKINKEHQSIPKDDDEANNESDEILQLSEKDDRDDMHDEHIDKIMDSEPISAEEFKDAENLLSNEDINDEVFTEDNLSNVKDKECKLEIINKSASEMEKILDNVCKQSATKELMIKIGKLSNIEEKRNTNNKENRTLNIINDASIENNTQSIINVDSTSTKCLTPICANKSSSEKETKFTKNESSINKRRHSKESVEITTKHDILSKEDDNEEKMDISMDSSISDATHKQNLSSSSVNDTTKRQSFVSEGDNKSITKDTNESVLSQHEAVEIVDRVIVEDKTSIKQIYKSTGEIEEVTKDKVGKMEHSIMDINSDISKDSNKTELNKISFLSKSKDDADQKIDKKKGIMITDISSVTIADGKIEFESGGCVNLHATESVPESSNTALKTLNSTSNESNEDNSVIQNTQSLNETEASEYVTSISSKRTERKLWLKNSAKEDLKQKSTDDVHDHMEKEKENLELKNQENKNTDPDVIVSNLIRDTFSDNSNKKVIEKEIDVETISVNSNSQLSKESKNESENESDLVMNKKARKTTENLKMEEEAESVDYDKEFSENIKKYIEEMSKLDKLLRNQEDAMVKTSDKKSFIIEEKKMDYDNKAVNSKDEERHMVKICEDFSDTEDEDDLTAAINKSLIEYKANKSLNKSGDQSVSKLNKSGQTVAKSMERSFKTHEESDEQVEDDANELNRSSQVNVKNTSLSKLMEKRKSLNKSSTKDTPLKQGSKIVQNISINKSQLDHSKNELDTDLGKKLKKKHSLNKSQNQNENVNEPEKQSSSKPVITKTLDLIDDESNDSESSDSEIIISVMDFECKNYSTTANMESIPDKMLHSSDEDNSRTSKLVMINSDTEASTSIHSDIKREYNLDGAEQKFSDDDIPGDECRASESEDSDSDDGSDLADFIVNDNEIEEEDNDDDEEEKSNSEGENEQNIEEIEDAEEEEVEDTEKEEVDDENENEQNVKEKDKFAKKKKIKDKSYKQAHINVEDEILDTEKEDTDNEKSFKYISPFLNTKTSSSSDIKSTKIKQDSKKSNTMKNKTILLDTSDSDSSIKNISSVQEKEDTILLAEQAINKHFEEHFERILTERSKNDSETSEEMGANMKYEFLATKLFHFNLPFESMETTEKAGSSKPSPGMAELHKTVNITHTESPTIRYLRKEKLNESAPEIKINIKTDSNSDRLKEKLSPVKQTKDIAQTKTKLESNEEEISNLISLNDEAVQEKSDRKKRKTPAEDILDENIADEALNLDQDMRESNVPKKKKKKKNINLATDIVIGDDTCKDTRQINKKEKKQKKRQLQIIERNENENVNDANVLQKNIHKKKKTKLAQHKSENDEIQGDLDLVDLSDNYLAVEKKTELPKIVKNKEIISEKRTREETTSSSQIKISKLKSDKNLASNKSQDIASDKIKAKNAAFAKAREEVLEAIHATEMRIRAKKELKKKKQEDEKNKIREQQALRIPDKTQRKQVVQKNDFLQPSTSRVKRLSNDVIENLPDQPTKAKKKRKLSQGLEWITPSEHSSTTVKDEGFFTVSSAGSTTQFTVINLRKAKKLSSKSCSTAAVSFRQRILARNREPVSAYMMYLEKQKATSTSQSSRNAF